jgi:hypothetical protein
VNEINLGGPVFRGSHVLDPRAWKLHCRVLKFDFGAPDVVGTGSECGKRADRGYLDRRLVGDTVPVVLWWLRRRGRVRLRYLLNRLLLRQLLTRLLVCRLLRSIWWQCLTDMWLARMLRYWLMDMLLILHHRGLGLLCSCLLRMRLVVSIRIGHLIASCLGGLGGVESFLCRRASTRGGRKGNRAVLHWLSQARSRVRDFEHRSFHRMP